MSPISIRPAEPRDVAAITRIYDHAVRHGTASFELAAPDEAEMARRQKELFGGGFPYIVAEQAAAVVGYAYAGQHSERAAYQWSVNVSVYLAQNVHRAGIGRGLYTSLFALVRLQGYVSAYAGITLPNDASVGLHEAMGFTPVGTFHAIGHKFGRWHDVGWYERELQPLPPAPPEPRSVRQLLDTPAWDGHPAGVFSWRPPVALVEELSDLLDGVALDEEGVA